MFSQIVPLVLLNSEKLQLIYLNICSVTLVYIEENH